MNDYMKSITCKCNTAAIKATQAAVQTTDEHATLSEPKMGENKNQQYPSSSRLGQGNGNKTIGGEIVEVQGGHIVRSIGRKDRHSKVCTAKGPRDRRVRLAAHTAIQFYDVQDRLGYDRPSKAVDWLINKAKSAIDELAQLPPWRPVGCDNWATTHERDEHGKSILEDGHEQEGFDGLVRKRDLNVQDSSFLPLQLDSDTIRSLFPLGASADSSSSVDVQFHSFEQTHDLMSTSGRRQDLSLSLQTFQDSVSMNNQHISSLGSSYDGNGLTWLDQNNQRLLQSWNSSNNNNNNSVSGDLFNSQTVSQPMLEQQVLAQNQFLTTQRGPLQSSNNTPSVHAWIDQFAAIDPHHHQGLVVPVYPSSSISGIGFASGISGYAGFHIPARIHEDDGFSDKPSTVSSDSHHLS